MELYSLIYGRYFHKKNILCFIICRKHFGGSCEFETAEGGGVRQPLMSNASNLSPLYQYNNSKSGGNTGNSADGGGRGGGQSPRNTVITMMTANESDGQHRESFNRNIRSVLCQLRFLGLYSSTAAPRSNVDNIESKQCKPNCL